MRPGLTNTAGSYWAEKHCCVWDMAAKAKGQRKVWVWTADRAQAQVTVLLSVYRQALCALL